MNKNINFKEYKDQIVNVIVISAALLLASQIYNAQNKSAKAILAQKDEKIKKNEILAEIDKSAKEIDAYRKVFSKKDMSSVIDAINTVIRESGIRSLSIRPESEQNYGQYILKRSLSLAITADNYHAIGKFISRLESHADIYHVESINIKIPSERQEGTRAYKLEANLKINNFSFKD